MYRQADTPTYAILSQLAASKNMAVSHPSIMADELQSSLHLPDPGAPPPRDPAKLWLYVRTQWRRAFGLNVSQVEPLLFVGGEFSTAQWPRLHALGIRAVLSLQAEREDQFVDPLPARVLRLHVEDFYPPSIDQLHQAVVFLRQNHADHLSTLIHCHAGVGRAPLTTAAFLMTRGLSVAEALERIQRARPIIRLNERQQRRLAEWMRVLQQP